jgi:TnpA family transposase
MVTACSAVSIGTLHHSGTINPKYGSEPAVLFYTHISDQYTPFHTTVVDVGVRDATDVLDGLLYHESDLRIEEHYTDTAGFPDHLFALMHLLAFCCAPRIRDVADKRIFIPTGEKDKKLPVTRAVNGAFRAIDFQAPRGTLQNRTLGNVSKPHASS